MNLTAIQKCSAVKCSHIFNSVYEINATNTGTVWEVASVNSRSSYSTQCVIMFNQCSFVFQKNMSIAVIWSSFLLHHHYHRHLLVSSFFSIGFASNRTKRIYSAFILVSQWFAITRHIAIYVARHSQTAACMQCW